MKNLKRIFFVIFATFASCVASYGDLAQENGLEEMLSQDQPQRYTFGEQCLGFMRDYWKSVAILAVAAIAVLLLSKNNVSRSIVAPSQQLEIQERSPSSDTSLVKKTTPQPTSAVKKHKDVYVVNWRSDIPQFLPALSDVIGTVPGANVITVDALSIAKIPKDAIIVFPLYESSRPSISQGDADWEKKPAVLLLNSLKKQSSNVVIMMLLGSNNASIVKDELGLPAFGAMVSSATQNFSSRDSHRDGAHGLNSFKKYLEKLS